MRPLTRPGLALAIALAVVAVPFLASGALATPNAPKAPAANSTTYQDSSGEDPAAPDITTITVSNDDAATITFKITIPNRAQYSSDVAVVMFLDSDANQATGDPESLGADYIIQLIQGEVLLFKWDGATTRSARRRHRLDSSWASGATIKINASELGNTRKLSFDVTAVSGVVVRPDDRRDRLYDLQARLRADDRLLHVPAHGHEADPRRAEPQADAGPTRRRTLVHAAARRRAFGHGGGRAERARHVHRARR